MLKFKKPKERSAFFSLRSMEMNACFTKSICHLRGKKPSKINIFQAISVKQKRRSAIQINSKFLKDFDLFIPCLTTYFSDVTAFVSLKVATIRTLEVNNPLKITIFKVIFSAKTEKCHRSNLCFSHTFEIFIPSLTFSFIPIFW